MIKTKITAGAVALLAAVLILAGGARAGSLWQDTSGSLFDDGKARFVGDILTIVVSENTSATNKSSTEIQQAESMNSGTGVGIVGQFLQEFGIESTDQYSGNGSTTSNNKFTTTVSAEVVEVLPNGNLVVEARRSVVVNDETQMVVLSGVVRTRDVSADNTIASSKIANAQIRYTGRGPIARRQHTGILNKLFDWIF